MKEHDCHREHRELTGDIEGYTGIWSQSGFRLSDLIQALCELTDPKQISTGNGNLVRHCEDPALAGDDVSSEALAKEESIRLTSDGSPRPTAPGPR